jgi:hypothetical protein
MSKLSEVYDLIAGLQKRNLPVPKELQQEATELEIDELREELAVAVEEHVQPVLDRIKSNWVLVLHHRPDASVRMVATREEEVLSLLDDAVELLPAVSRAAVPAPEPEPQPASYTEVVEEEEPNTVADEGRAQSIGFSVRFADGTIIDEADAKTTLVNTLRYMGFEQVAQFTMVRFGKGVYPLVCRRQRTDLGKNGNPVKWQEAVENGWYVYTNMGNPMKKRILMLAAEYLGLQITITDHPLPELFPATPHAPIRTSPPKDKKEKGHRALFSLNGRNPLDKRNSVLAAVRLYKSNHPNATYAEMRRTFPASLQGSYGVISSLDEIEERRRQGKEVDERYFLDPHEIMISADGVQFAVSNQWGDQFSRFQEHVRTLGWTLKEV